MKRVGVTLVLSIAVLSSCVSTLSRSELAAEYYNIGNAYYELERYDTSVTFLSRAVELDPSLARASYNLARAYTELERFDDAFSLLEELLAADPQNTLLLETAAFVAYFSNDLQSAAEYYDLALALSPADIDLLQNRATVADELGDSGTAAELLERAVILAPQESGLLLELSFLYEEAGRPQAAVDALERYLAEVPEDNDARVRLGGVLAEQEFYADALSVLDLITQPTAESAFLQARVLLLEVGDEEAGVGALETALSLGFSDGEAARALLADSSLVARETVRATLEQAGLLAPDEVDDEARQPE